MKFHFIGLGEHHNYSIQITGIIEYLRVESIREFLQIEGLLFEEEEAIDCSTLRARLWNLFEYPES